MDLLDFVMLLEDFAEEGLKVGTFGTIVHTFDSSVTSDVVIVEFYSHGETITVVDVPKTKLKVVERHKKDGG